MSGDDSFLQERIRRPHGRVVPHPERRATPRKSRLRYQFAIESLTPDPLADPESDGPRVLPEAWVDEFGTDLSVSKIKKGLNWYVIWDKHSQDKENIKQEWELIRAESDSCKIKWRHRGEHLVVCMMGTEDRKRVAETRFDHPTYTQVVSDTHNLQRKSLQRIKKSPVPDPIHTLDVVTRTIEVLQAAEGLQSGADKKKVIQYKKRLKELTQYKAAMERLFPDWKDDAILSGDADSPHFIPVFATYVSEKTGEQRDQRLCLEMPLSIDMKRRKKRRKGKDVPDRAVHTVKLYDWTNPTLDRLKGVYSGKAASINLAVRTAMVKWKSERIKRHAYFHPGNFSWEISPRAALGIESLSKQEDQFDTEGPGFWEKVEDFFSTLALPATLAAMLFTILPIPGGRAIGGALWTYVFTTTTGTAVLRLGRRHGDGVHSMTDDALDVLEIAGSMFGLAQVKWVQRAVCSKVVGDKKLRFLLYGDVTTSGVEGVLVGVDHAVDFLKIVEDDTLTADERLSLLGRLLGRGLSSAAMSYVSIRGAKGEAAALSRQIDQKRLNKLKKRTNINDPAQDVDLDERVKFKKHTDELRTKIKVEDDEIEAPNSRKRRRKKTRGKARAARTEFPDAAPPETRGMRTEDDFSFREAASTKKQHIFVRESNPASLEYIGKRGFEGKPVELKAKTATSGKHAGLALADPKDSGLIKMLRKDKKYSKIKGRKARYKAYVSDLETQGFKVDPDNGHVITWKDKPGSKGFYSDYDIHGVYYARTGTHGDSGPVMEFMNSKAEQRVVQHKDHDDWPERSSKSKAGSNYGPQPPVTVYAPDGKTYRLETWKDMKEYAKAQKPRLKLEQQYRGKHAIRWKLWRKRRRAAGKSDEM